MNLVCYFKGHLPVKYYIKKQDVNRSTYIINIFCKRCSKKLNFLS